MSQYVPGEVVPQPPPTGLEELLAPPKGPLDAPPAPSSQSNGTMGRVYTEEVVQPTNMSAEEMQREGDQFREELQRQQICNDGIMGRIACGQPIVEVSSVEASGQVGGWGVNGKIDENGPSLTGGQFGKNPKLTVRVGLCVKIVGAKKPDHQVKAYGSAGYFYGSVDPLNQTMCVGGQWPPGVDYGMQAK